MKFLIVLTTIILAINAIEESLTKTEWDDFKKTQKKSYSNSTEESYRFRVFLENLKLIEEHNAKYEAGLTSWKMGVTPFSDMTPKEFQDLLKTSKSFDQQSFIRPWIPKFQLASVSSHDWRDQQAVSPVKDQERCGACWAVSAVGALETQYYLKYGIMEIFSIQTLINCSQSYGNKGCNGGWMAPAYRYIKDHGIPTEAEYPYVGVVGPCIYEGGGFNISDFHQIKGERNIRSAVQQHGTVSVAIHATNNMSWYKSGIFDDSACSSDPKDLNHAVLIVGFGTQNGLDYWIVQNSWGKEWGDKGYIKMVRNKNLCGIGNYGFFPVL